MLNFFAIFLHRVVACQSVLVVKKTWRKYSQRFSARGCYVQGVCKLRFSTYPSLYRANDTGFGYSYNIRRIGTSMWSIEWCHFQWPWVILLGHDILQLQITRKWYKIYLQWQIDMKSLIGFNSGTKQTTTQDNTQVALLSQRGRAMLRVRQ